MSIGAPPFAPPLPTGSSGVTLAIEVAFAVAMAGQANELRSGDLEITYDWEWVTGATGIKGGQGQIEVEVDLATGMGAVRTTGGELNTPVEFDLNMSGFKAASNALNIEVEQLIIAFAQAWWDMGSPDGLGYTDDIVERGFTREEES